MGRSREREGAPGRGGEGEGVPTERHQLNSPDPTGQPGESRVPQDFLDPGTPHCIMVHARNTNRSPNEGQSWAAFPKTVAVAGGHHHQFRLICSEVSSCIEQEVSVVEVSSRTCYVLKQHLSMRGNFIINMHSMCNISTRFTKTRDVHVMLALASDRCKSSH